MNIQIELLQEANKELEERLAGSTEQEQVLVREASGLAERNVEICRELESLKKLTQVNHNNLQVMRKSVILCNMVYWYDVGRSG